MPLNILESAVAEAYGDTRQSSPLMWFFMLLNVIANMALTMSTNAEQWLNGYVPAAVVLSQCLTLAVDGSILQRKAYTVAMSILSTGGMLGHMVVTPDLMSRHVIYAVVSSTLLVLTHLEFIKLEERWDALYACMLQLMDKVRAGEITRGTMERAIATSAHTVDQPSLLHSKLG